MSLMLNVRVTVAHVNVYRMGPDVQKPVVPHLFRMIMSQISPKTARVNMVLTFRWKQTRLQMNNNVAL